jgi:hypothetical protein
MPWRLNYDFIIIIIIIITIIIIPYFDRRR